MSFETIPVSEAAKRLGKDVTFVRNGVEQGVLPGAVVKSEGGRRNIVIPRVAFEQFMCSWHPTPSDELIQALINKLSKGGKQNG